jgi:Spy/CpxP family protein refolding chaperone
MKEKSMKTKGVILGTLSVVLLGFVMVSAQEPQGTNPPRQPRPPMDPFGDVMFPPDAVMRHASEIGLSDEQKDYVKSEIRKTANRFNELQWQVEDTMDALRTTMKAEQVDQQHAMAQLDKLLDAEREIKRMQFGLAMSIKNKLTTEQQGKLRDIIKQMRGPGGGPDGPGSPRRGPDGGPPRTEGRPRRDGPAEPAIP